MARYQVRGPDGKVHVIEGPDDATPAEIEAFATQTIPKIKPAPVQDDAITKGAKNFAQDGSAYDNFMAGAGKAVVDLGSGIGQLLGIGPSQEAIDERKRLDAPLMNTNAGLAGNIGGNVAATLIPAGGIAKGAAALGLTKTALAARALVNPAVMGTARGTAAAAVGGGALIGGLQPTASDDSRIGNMTGGGIAGLLGQGLASGLGRLAQPVQNALAPLQQKAIDTLSSAGVPLNLAQRTGSPTLNRIASSFGDNPFTMGVQSDFRDSQKAAYNNALLKLIGESGPAATQDVMGGARDRTNQVFGNVLTNTDVPLTPQMATALSDVQAGALENARQPVSNIINRAFNAVDPQTGTIPGQTAYNIVKDMRDMSQGAGADGTLRHFAGDAKETMLSGVRDALSPADRDAFDQARRQQAIMYTLEGAVDPKTGDISANKLANILGQKKNRSTSIYGQGDQELNDLAQAGAGVLREGPNSGTTARALAAATLPSLAAGAVGGGYDYFKTGDATDALLGGAKFAGATYAAPRLAQYVINNQSLAPYLANGVQNNLLRALLSAPTQNALVGQGVRQVPSALYQLAARPDILTAPVMTIHGNRGQ